MRLNIGSGQRPFADPWVNVDCQPQWHPHIVSRGEDLKFPNNSAEVIVLHHVLEHYGCNDAGVLLKNCHRMLQPRGSLLVFIPDIIQLTNMVLRHVITEQVYFTNVYGAYMGDEADRHKWGYTVTTMRRVLNEAGFERTCAFDWRPIKGADIAKDSWIIGVEAVK